MSSNSGNSRHPGEGSRSSENFPAEERTVEEEESMDEEEDLGNEWERESPNARRTDYNVSHAENIHFLYIFKQNVNVKKILVDDKVYEHRPGYNYPELFIYDSVTGTYNWVVRGQN